MTLEQRMDRLERQARRYRMTTMAIVLMAVAAVSMGQTGDYEYITCRGLKVIGVNGITTSISQTDTGDGILTTYSSSGKKLVGFGVTIEGNGGLATFSSSGKTLVTLG